jgi:hypothetical protein
LVQAFLKKWWVESDAKAPNLPLLLPYELVVYKLLTVHRQVSMHSKGKQHNNIQKKYIEMKEGLYRENTCWRSLDKYGELQEGNNYNYNEHARNAALFTHVTHHGVRQGVLCCYLPSSTAYCNKDMHNRIRERYVESECRRAWTYNNLVGNF